MIVNILNDNSVKKWYKSIKTIIIYRKNRMKYFTQNYFYYRINKVMFFIFNGTKTF